MGEDDISSIISDPNAAGIQGQQSAEELRPEMPMATDESQPLPTGTAALFADQKPAPSPEVLSFYTRYATAMQAWFKEKGNMNFPIYEDPKTGKLTWINRAIRSAARKAKQKHA